MDKRTQSNEPDDDVMQAMIGKQLRTLYDSVLAEPIPDNLVELLIKLDDLTAEDGPHQNARSDDGSHHE